MVKTNIRTEVERVWNEIKAHPAIKGVGVQYISKLKGKEIGQFSKELVEEKRKIFEASLKALTEDFTE